MAIDLREHEATETLAKPEKYAKKLEKIQQRLAEIQAAYMLHKKSAIIAIEGWDAAGKGGIIRRAVAEMDPRHFSVHSIGAPSAQEKAHHYLWRFWKALPATGHIAIFDRSWYGRVLVERVENFCSEAQWRRAYDEINAFESCQIDDGAVLVKLFIHINQDTQDERFAERLENPWKRWKTGVEDYRNRARRADYLAAMHDMFEKTDTRWAPWQVINGNDKKYARITALAAIADQLEAQISMTPPAADPAVVALAEQALGHPINLDAKLNDD